MKEKILILIWKVYCKHTKTETLQVADDKCKVADGCFDCEYQHWKIKQNFSPLCNTVTLGKFDLI